MAISAIPKITFDEVSSSSTFGKFLLEDISDYVGNGIAAADVKGYFEIQSPSNSSYYIGDQNPTDYQGTTEILTALFQGSGLDDLTQSGTYTGSDNNVYEVMIDSISASPDTFKWRKGDGSWTTGVACSTSNVLLGEGVSIKFGAIDGHTLNDSWLIYVRDGSFIVDTIAIPVDASSNPECGVYQFRLTTIITGAVQPGTYQSAWISFNFCPEYPSVASISMITDCFNLKITGEDTSNYGAYTTINRVFTLHPPSISGDPDYTVNSNILEYTFSWTNTAYELNLTTAVGYEYSDNVYVNADVKGTYAEIINCDYDLCSIVNCFAKFVADFDAQVLDVGGMTNMQAYKINSYLAVAGKIQLHLTQVKCGQFTEAKATYEWLKAVLQCPCSCNDGQPTQINPVGSSSSNTFVASYPIQVSISGTVITYSIDPTWKASVDALYSTVVLSGDGYNTVSVATDSNGNKTYTFTEKWKAQRMSYNLTISKQSGTPYVVFSIANLDIHGDRYQSPTHAMVGGTPANLSELNSYFADFIISNFLAAGAASDTDKVSVNIIEGSDGLSSVEPVMDGATTTTQKFHLRGIVSLVTALMASITTVTLTIKFELT